jgi:hypothetical protein
LFNNRLVPPTSHDVDQEYDAFPEAHSSACSDRVMNRTRSVWHWRQGPYDTPDQTLIVDVVPPSQMATALATGGTGHLTTYVVAIDFRGREINRAALPRLGLELEQERAVVGLTMLAYEQRKGITQTLEETW